MPAKQRPQHVIPATLATSAVAIALLAFSDRVGDAVRAGFRDGLRPGLTALEQSVATARIAAREWSESGAPQALPAAKTPDASNEHVIRHLQAANANLAERLEASRRVGVSPYRGAAQSPLVLADLVEARVLGRETAEAWRGGWLLNRGSNHGIRESALVLRDGAPLLDIGTDARLEPGFAVFAGRTVVGRIRAAGRWSATLEPVTADTFRGHAQLIRKTRTGYVFGATGVMEGNGKGSCTLKMIPSAEPVAVGDGVYTVSNGGDFPFPMYYGRVTRAEQIAGDNHWEIDVEPAARNTALRVVQILRKRLNPARAKADSDGDRPVAATAQLKHANGQ